MIWGIENVDQVWPLTVQHLWLSVIPTILGLLLSVPIGMLVHGRPRTRRVVVVVSSMIFTIPSLALFVVIPTLIGTKMLDPLNVLVALTLYSIALLVRTVLESLDSVPEEVRAAAEAVGTSRFRQAVGIDLPLAIPVLTAGTRVVAVTNVSLVSVGAVIGVGGLGQLFTAGYQRNYPDQVFAGIIAILILAFVMDRILAALGGWLSPWTRATQVSRATRRRLAERTTQTEMLAVVDSEGTAHVR